MKVLIAYASKTGTTEKCAKILNKLVDDSVLCDLTKKTPDLSQHQFVIVGGSIRMGTLHKAAQSFIKKNHETLAKKKCAFFTCNCGEADINANFKKNIPADLLKKAVVTASFGGELELDKQKGMDKLIAKMVLKKGQDGAKLHISTEAINKFAEKIK